MSIKHIRVDVVPQPGYLEHECWPETHEVVFANEFIIVTTYECCFALWCCAEPNSGELISGNLWKKGREFISREEVARFLSEVELPFVGEFDRTFWDHMAKREAES